VLKGPGAAVADAGVPNSRCRRAENKMKAVVCTGYGPPEALPLREVGKPVPVMTKFWSRYARLR
jgi:hypothetical protein